jgi:hypothetical protein
MPWFPHFLNPWPAIITLGVAAPLLVLLYFLKLRRQVMPVPSTLLWKKAIQDLQVNAPFQRLRRNLLLLLQALLLLLMVLALSRPTVNYTPGAGKVAVILVDRSASMAVADAGGKTRLEKARAAASDLVDTLDKNSVAMVIAFDESAEIAQAFTADRALLKRSIESIRQTDRRSQLRQAYDLAEAQAVNFNPEQLRPLGEKPEVWLYSDGRVSDRSELTLHRAVLTYQPIGSENPDNVGVVALGARRNFERPQEVQIFSRLANYGPAPVRTDVVLRVDGKIRRTQNNLLLFPEQWSEQQRKTAEATLPGAASGAIEFKLDLVTGAQVQVEQTHRDALAADDSARVIVPPPRMLKAVLVTNGNYFLGTVFQSLTLKDTSMMTPEKYEQSVKDTSKFAPDIVIFDHYSPKALPAAGNFLYFGGVPPLTKLGVVQEAGAPGVITKWSPVLTWKYDHPILRHLNLRKLTAQKMLKLQVPPDAEVLIDGVAGPMVVLYREARHTHLVTSFDLMDSTWPTDITFPVFMDRTIQFLAVGSDMDVRESYPPGATVKIPRAALAQAGVTDSITLNGPEESHRVMVPVAGDFVLPPLDRVGVYTTTPPIPQLEKIAVNLLDDNESNIAVVKVAPGGTGGAGEVVSGKSRLDLWRYILAFGVIPLCMIEWWVYTSRVRV